LTCGNAVVEDGWARAGRILRTVRRPTGAGSVDRRPRTLDLRNGRPDGRLRLWSVYHFGTRDGLQALTDAGHACSWTTGTTALSRHARARRWEESLGTSHDRERRHCQRTPTAAWWAPPARRQVRALGRACSSSLDHAQDVLRWVRRGTSLGHGGFVRLDLILADGHAHRGVRAGSAAQRRNCSWRHASVDQAVGVGVAVNSAAKLRSSMFPPVAIAAMFP
jgi:hypothetical protein